MDVWMWIPVGVLGALLLVVIYDVTQSERAILHNFPLVGHFRGWIAAMGPPLRQYIVAANNEERPFTRDQRRWVGASAAKENTYFGFGTDNDLERSPNYIVLRHSAFPLHEPHAGDDDYDPHYSLPCAKVIGAARGRAKAFRPESIVGVSAMSFGSLGATAVEALNRGCALASCLHNTGEGGISPHHMHGGGLIWQLGTGYYGARAADGRLDYERLVATAAEKQVKAIEIKLSQGAKPGLGGVLPGRKVTAQIAKIRGIPVGQDCLSPSAHREFNSVDSLLDVVERIAESTGLPVGIKSAIGDMSFWVDLADALEKDPERAVDYIQIDGGEGGTGAAPLAFSDHVALPFKVGFSSVYALFAERGLTDRVVFVGSGKLGFPEEGVLAMALGCDMIMVAREAMLSIGCIQAQECHTGHCPAGVATHNPWLMRGLDPTNKGARLANYMTTLRKELTRMARASGKVHPALITTDQVSILDEHFGARSLTDVFGYKPEWGLPSDEQASELAALLANSPAKP
jgi:glutamate synthase domain-containing protein 2